MATQPAYETDPRKMALNALKLVMALHNTRDVERGSLPGHRVFLDPMAQKQVEAAITALEKNS